MSKEKAPKADFEESAVALASFFSLLANPTRLKVLSEITNKSAAQISKELHVTEPAISPHVAKFRDLGLIREAKGKLTEGGSRYELTPEGRRALEIIAEANPIAQRVHENLENMVADLRLISKQMEKGGFRSPVAQKVREYLGDLEKKLQ